VTEFLGELGNVAGLARALQEQGLSARGGLAAFRSAGGRIRDARWFSVWGEVAQAADRSAMLGLVDHDAAIPAEALGTWAAGREGQYATQVQVFVRDRGGDVVYSVQYTHVTDEPHTLGAATNAAIDLYSDNQAQYEQDVLGAVPTGAYRMTGSSAA
jgi:hypothetical protein